MKIRYAVEQDQLHIVLVSGAGFENEEVAEGVVYDREGKVAGSMPSPECICPRSCDGNLIRALGSGTAAEVSVK
jgi:hypothetical protein